MKQQTQFLISVDNLLKSRRLSKELYKDIAKQRKSVTANLIKLADIQLLLMDIDAHLSE